ncbi:MAG: hypothetical protein J7L26_00285 [Candidatus Aminicenantes bacterium]|nr:hypothetical protein [Candidatus Aminicenantes bacterium]
MITIIMIVYYFICAYLAGILFWSFIKEKKSLNNLILYLLVIFPLILRVLRIK